MDCGEQQTDELFIPRIETKKAKVKYFCLFYIY